MSFEKAVSFTLRMEGGYVNHPADRGGETNFGVTKPALCRAFYEGIVKHTNVAALTRAEAVEIYRAFYWTPIRWEDFAEPVDAVLFDICVNHGLRNCARIAQRACISCGVVVAADGVLGPKTRAALAELSARCPFYLAHMLLIKRLAFYDAIVKARPQQKVFLNGWRARTAAMHREFVSIGNYRLR
ncbi:MAG: hypothetical protein HUJ86_06765 [Synergistes sp.]|nr:hypothetical protein [Synergistes sp.]